MEQVGWNSYYKSASFPYQPLISLATPVYNTNPKWLHLFITSVLNQTYANWELQLCNNGSDKETTDILRWYANQHTSRIRVVETVTNVGGAMGLQIAVDRCTGSYIGLPDSDDELAPHALHTVVKYLNHYGAADVNIIYTNELMTDEEGNITLPIYKPKFNPRLLLFLHYFGHLTLYKGSLLHTLGVTPYRGTYDYGLSLRASRTVAHDHTIINIPEFLYKYRIYPSSTSHMHTEELRLGGREALMEHLELSGFGEVRVHENIALYQVQFPDGALVKIDFDTLYNYPVSKPHLYEQLFNMSNLYDWRLYGN